MIVMEDVNEWVKKALKGDSCGLSVMYYVSITDNVAKIRNS